MTHHIYVVHRLHIVHWSTCTCTAVIAQMAGPSQTCMAQHLELGFDAVMRLHVVAYECLPDGHGSQMRSTKL